MTLFTAFLVGTGFGFFLERAGLGNSRKLASQFYGTDMTVFKMMFTAIITCMLGLYWLTRLGLVSQDVLTPLTTYTWPQLVGGLMFGVGFLIGGYCPGTCCVASSSGRQDGWVFLGGMLAGMALFHLSGPAITDFAVSSDRGPSSLSDVLGISYPATVFVIVAGAIAAFWGAEWIERRMAGR